ncbi:MAG: methyl-accepting chemotaxis protein [Bacteriovorax sp.]
MAPPEAENAGPNQVNDHQAVVLDKTKKIFRHNSFEISAISEYLKRTSDYLMGIFDDQFFILKKVEDHAKHTRLLVNDVESKINDAVSLSNHAREGADIGKSNMENLSISVKSFEEIGQLIAEFSNVVSVLNSQMREIDSVVFMAKLLSFNATIEAARVGDLGQGMSVVALEMTKLSQQIGETSQKIQVSLKTSNESLSTVQNRVSHLLTNSTDLIHSSQKVIHSIIEEIYVLSEKISGVTDSLDSYKKSTEEFDEILTRMTKTSNTLGTASANTKLARINLEELKNYNENCEEILR